MVWSFVAIGASEREKRSSASSEGLRPACVRLAEIIEAVGRALPARIAPIIGDEGGDCRARFTLVEQGTANEVVGEADSAMLGIGRDEGAERGDGIVVTARFPQLEAFGVGGLGGVFLGDGRFGRRGGSGSGRLGFGLGRRRGLHARGKRFRSRRRGRRGDALLELGDPPLLVAAEPLDLRVLGALAVRILLGHADEVGHLPFERVEPLRDGGDRRLGCRGIVEEPRGVCWPPLGEDLALHLLDLLFEAVDALLGAWRRALRRGRRESPNRRNGRRGGEDEAELGHLVPPGDYAILECLPESGLPGDESA
jgi:hypothetical protein